MSYRLVYSLQRSRHFVSSRSTHFLKARPTRPTCSFLLSLSNWPTPPHPQQPCPWSKASLPTPLTYTSTFSTLSASLSPSLSLPCAFLGSSGYGSIKRTSQSLHVMLFEYAKPASTHWKHGKCHKSWQLSRSFYSLPSCSSSLAFSSSCGMSTVIQRLSWSPLSSR